METIKIVSLSFLLLSCNDSLKNQNNSVDDAVEVNLEENNDQLGSGDPFFDESSLPNVLQDMDVGACDTIALDYPDTPGATSYFAGAYMYDNTRWRGREKWVLFPNKAWQSIAYENWQEGDDELADIAQGFPCEVVWDIAVTVLPELETCLACEFAFFVEAIVNPTLTSCPQALWNDPGSRTWQTNYEIASFNGNSIFYFQESGNAFGWGYSSEEELNFLSEASCKWF